MTVLSEGVSQELSSIPAEKHIENLKSGVLLIKLNTQSRRINARIKAGKIEKAEKLRTEVEKEHKEIMAAFEKHYEFSDYYFFYSDDSDAVLMDKDYSLLFTSADRKNVIPVEFAENSRYLLMLGLHPGFPSADKYHLLLSHLSEKGRRKLPRSMPRSFHTRSSKLFCNNYDFDKAIRRINDRLQKVDIYYRDIQK